MSTTPKRATSAKRTAPPRSKVLRYRQLGGWDIGDKVKDPRSLFKVTIKTSIEWWDEYVLARDCDELGRWLKARYPNGWCKGWEPDVVQLVQLTGEGLSMDSIYMTL